MDDRADRTVGVEVNGEQGIDIYPFGSWGAHRLPRLPARPQLHSDFGRAELVRSSDSRLFEFFQGLMADGHTTP